MNMIIPDRIKLAIFTFVTALILAINTSDASEQYNVPATLYPQVITIDQHLDKSRDLNLSEMDRHHLNQFLLARCSAVGLTVIGLIENNFKVLAKSDYLKHRSRDYWHKLAAEAVMTARAISPDEVANDALNTGIENAKMFMKIYDRSLTIEGNDLSKGLLVNDAITCAQLLSMKDTNS
jgi:hypothetical protein